MTSDCERRSPGRATAPASTSESPRSLRARPGAPGARPRALWAVGLGLFASAALAAAPGCGGLTIGPVVRREFVVVHAGTGIEVLDDVVVQGRVIRPGAKDGDPEDVAEVNIGGWIAVHPDHWAAIKREVARLRAKAGEADPDKEAAK